MEGGRPIVRDELADDIGSALGGQTVGLLAAHAAAWIVPAVKFAGVLLGGRLFAEAAVGMAALHEQLRVFLIEPAALGLHIGADRAADVRTFVVLEMALLHSPVYNVNSALDETPLIRVLNAENELALIVAGNEIGIERGTEIADVHVPRGRRGEPRTYLARGDALFHILKPLHVFHFVPPAPKYLRLTFLILFCKLAVVKTNLF